MSGETIESYQPAALSFLLAWLDADSERAGAKYEQLRHKLILFFNARQCQIRAEDLADRTLDVVARRLQEGVELHIDAASSYCYGVAQNIWREYQKGAKPEPLTREPIALPSDPFSRNERLDCLEQCLNELHPESRSLIETYYKDEKRAKIDYRKKMADQFGISVNALRLRAHQIRVRLETCMKCCLGKSA